MNKELLQNVWIKKDASRINIEQLYNMFLKDQIDYMYYENGLLVVIDSTRFHRKKIYRDNVINIHSLTLKFISSKPLCSACNLSTSSCNVIFKNGDKLYYDALKARFFYQRQQNLCKKIKSNK